MPAHKRILIIVENLPVPFDRRVWQEAQTLHSAGYSVRIICPAMNGYSKYRESLEGIEIYRHPLPLEADGIPGFIIEYIFALFFQTVMTFWILFRHGIDAIHACNPPDTIFLIGLVLRPFRVRFLFDQHDLTPELYLAKFNRQDFIYSLLMKLERLTYNTANTVICTNESYRDIAISRGNKNFSDIFIVRSAPDCMRFYPVSPDTKLKNGRHYLVCYVGVMGKQEGIDLLLTAIHHIVHIQNRMDISFLLIGSGPEMANLLSMNSQLGLSEHVVFTGRIPDNELLVALSTADVCVNPDRYNTMNDKSTMNKVMEYMAMGKPIVQFDLKEGRYSAADASLYAIPDNITDFADKIVELLDDPERRNTMGAAGRKRLREHLNWKYSQAELLKAYDHLFRPSSI